METNRAYPINLEANVLGIHVTAKGTVANPLAGAEMAAEVGLSRKSLAGFAPWLGRRRAAIGPLEAQLELKGSSGSYVLAPLRLRISKNAKLNSLCNGIRLISIGAPNQLLDR